MGDWLNLLRRNSPGGVLLSSVIWILLSHAGEGCGTPRGNELHASLEIRSQQIHHIGGSSFSPSPSLPSKTRSSGCSAYLTSSSRVKSATGSWFGNQLSLRGGRVRRQGGEGRAEGLSPGRPNVVWAPRLAKGLQGSGNLRAAAENQASEETEGERTSEEERERARGGAGEEEEEAEDIQPPHIDIVYQDEYMVVVSKPPNMLAHRSREATRQDTFFVLNCVRDQVGKEVYIANRLDRAASGLMVLTFSGETVSKVHAAMQAEESIKEYLALVRGQPDWDAIHHNVSLRDHDKKYASFRESATDFTRLASFDIEIQQPYIPPSPDPSDPDALPPPPDAPAAGAIFSRNLTLSVVACRIQTGRRHQIRRHLKGLGHNIVGDTTYGKGRINVALRECYGLPRLFLHARRLKMVHPFTSQELDLQDPLASDLSAFVRRLPNAPPPLLQALRPPPPPPSQE